MPANETSATSPSAPGQNSSVTGKVVAESTPKGVLNDTPGNDAVFYVTLGVLIAFIGVTIGRLVWWFVQGKTPLYMLQWPPGTKRVRNAFPYLITVVTGSRAGSDTEGTVKLTLHGNSSASKSYIIPGGQVVGHPKWKLFAKGNRDHFLVITDVPLGDFKHLTVEFATTKDIDKWFLSYVTINDMSNNKISYLHLHDWVIATKAAAVTTVLTPSVQQASQWKDSMIRGFKVIHLWSAIWCTTPAGSKLDVLGAVSLCFACISSILFATVWIHCISSNETDFSWASVFLLQLAALTVITMVTAILQVFLRFLRTSHWNVLDEFTPTMSLMNADKDPKSLPPLPQVSTDGTPSSDKGKSQPQTSANQADPALSVDKEKSKSQTDTNKANPTSSADKGKKNQPKVAANKADPNVSLNANPDLIQPSQSSSFLLIPKMDRSPVKSILVSASNRSRHVLPESKVDDHQLQPSLPRIVLGFRKKLDPQRKSGEAVLRRSEKEPVTRVRFTINDDHESSVSLPFATRSVSGTNANNNSIPLGECRHTDYQPLHALIRHFYSDVMTNNSTCVCEPETVVVEPWSECSDILVRVSSKLHCLRAIIETDSLLVARFVSANNRNRKHLHQVAKIGRELLDGIVNKHSILLVDLLSAHLVDLLIQESCPNNSSKQQVAKASCPIWSDIKTRLLTCAKEVIQVLAMLTAVELQSQTLNEVYWLNVNNNHTKAKADTQACLRDPYGVEDDVLSELLDIGKILTKLIDDDSRLAGLEGLKADKSNKNESNGFRLTMANEMSVESVALIWDDHCRQGQVRRAFRLCSSLTLTCLLVIDILANSLVTIVIGASLTHNGASQWVVSTTLGILLQSCIFELLKIIVFAFYWVILNKSIAK